MAPRWRLPDIADEAQDTRAGKGLERLRADNLALRQAAAAVLRAVRNDRLHVSVPSIAAALSPVAGARVPPAVRPHTPGAATRAAPAVSRRLTWR